MSKLRSAVSLAALASITASCAGPQGRVAAPSNFGGKQGEVGLATRALAAFNSGDTRTAIAFAERAVEKTPNDAGFRSLLGNVYFAAGRFWSAEAAFKDSLSLYSNQPQVVLKLALAEIALGKNDEAMSFLERGRPVLDPADYGLALALAGRPDEAVATLQSVARQPTADARVRQNLALAYALTGDWTNARTIAAQDVPANQLDQRIQQWMQLAKPSKPSQQVAALLGVTPAVTDQGQPMRLALGKSDARQAKAGQITVPLPPAKPVATVQAAPAPQVAEAAPLPEVVMAEAAPANLPQPQFAEVQAVPAPEPVAAAAPPPAPVTMALMAAATQAREAFDYFVPKKAAAKPAKAQRIAAAAPQPLVRRGNSQAVVQLGAYRSPEYVAHAWKTLTQRYPALREYLPMRARFDSPKGTYWRLSIQGYANQREAIAHCQALKGRGASCFVRRVAGDKPVQYASR